MKLSRIAEAAAAIILFSSPAFALDVGQTVGVRLGCKSLEVVERQITAFVAHGDEAVQAQFRVDVENGDCSVAPVVVPVEVQEVGKSTAVEFDGEDVRLTPFRFGDQFWGVAVEEATKS